MLKRLLPEVIKILDDECVVIATCNSIATNLIMSVFTQKVPLWISRRCFEYFLCKNNGEECLYELLESVLLAMQSKMEGMKTAELEKYLIDLHFVEDCFSRLRRVGGVSFIFEFKITKLDWSSYFGPLIDGKPHGHGVMMWTNGDLYNGQFEDGNM